MVQVALMRGGAIKYAVPGIPCPRNSRPELASGALVSVLPAPKRQIRFEAAIRSAERDPLILELFRRVSGLRID
ncbi:hypothetical protein GCM10019060_07360 [Novosphingobium pokkalii]|nr:hypothetical protein GCM10019060_07360 [Novosphingobium pokkalii]